MSTPLARVGIISIGDMGLGIANLLTANNYRVYTNATGRSQYTQDRASSAGVDLLSTDTELVEQSDYLFSIVPPRDALATAQRINAALLSRKKETPFYFLDLNATSPLTAQKMLGAFKESSAKASFQLRILDGGIIGGPPKRQQTTTTAHESSAGGESWYKPSIVLSGPHPLSAAPLSGAHLASLLNAKHVHDTIGPATGLKMCFASLNKGFTALAIQAMTTAEQLGVLPELQAHLAEYSPAIGAQAQRGVVAMCPKAYRWVGEMYEIADTMEVYGGFEGGASAAAATTQEEPQQGQHGGGMKSAKGGKGGDLFRSVGEIYRFVADDTELGKERVGHREKGTTPEEVAQICAQHLKPRERV